MPTWSELEKRFIELESALHSARLDVQTGTGGEFWYVAGARDNISKSSFEALSDIAGHKIDQSVAAGTLPEEIDAATGRVRWYRSLKAKPRFYEPGPVGSVTSDNGNEPGWIAMGSIRRPAAVSAAYCLELAAMTHEEEASKGQTTINVSGQNARLNVDSVDNSVNSIGPVSIQVFDDARSAIHEKIVGDAKHELLAKLDDLQKSVRTPNYAARYKEFVQLAANHVTALAPVIVALAAYLG